jgi:RNA polymerase sigma-70 factor (ECF subfamily)
MTTPLREATFFPWGTGRTSDRIASENIEPTTGSLRVSGVVAIQMQGRNPAELRARNTTMWSVSDETLYAGLAAGDRDATDAFVARFQRRVYGLARSIIGDDRLAEDVAQEALVRAWRHAAAYDPRRGSVATWLLTITRNLAIDEIRVRRPAAYDPEVLIATAPPSGERGPADVAVIGQDVLRLQRALATLPAEQRRAIVLAGVLGLSGREVAEHEDIPLGTAKTRIRAAMIRLRTLLVDEERAE